MFKALRTSDAETISLGAVSVSKVDKFFTASSAETNSNKPTPAD